MRELILWFFGPLAEQHYGVPHDPSRQLPRWVRRTARYTALVIFTALITLPGVVDSINTSTRYMPGAPITSVDHRLASALPYRASSWWPAGPAKVLRHERYTTLRLDTGWYGGPGPGGPIVENGPPLALRLSPTFTDHSMSMLRVGLAD